MKDKARVIGKIEAILATERPQGKGWKLDPKSGLYLRRSINKNMVVLPGLAFMAKSIQYGHADAGGTLRYMGVGTGYTTPAKDDTALVNQVVRLEIDSWDNTDIDADPVVMIATRLFLTTEGNGNLMEAGLFKASTGAPMFCRGLFGYGTISDVTQDNPALVTSVGHGLTDGDLIFIENVAGMTELNDNPYYVDVQSDDTFELYSDAGLTTPIDSGGYGAYSEASPDADTWKKIIPKTVAETLTVNYSLTFPAE